MIRALIIEDEIDAQKLLAKMLEEFMDDVEVVGAAGGVEEGISQIENLGPDIVFLDIELGDGNAFQLLKNLDKKDFQLIFTTAYEEYAIKAFKEEAIDYLLKPYSPSELIEAVNRAKTRLDEGSLEKKIDHLTSKIAGKQKTRLKISTSGGLLLIPIKDIVRVEADRTYCTVHVLDHEPVLVSKPLKEIEEELPHETFFRSHSGHLISIDYVSKYDKSDGGSIVMSDGSLVPLARRRRDDFFLIYD